MYTLTDPSNSRRPKSQHSSATQWKTSSTHRQKPTESWKTSSPSFAPAVSYQRHSQQLHRHSMPATWLSPTHDQGRYQEIVPSYYQHPSPSSIKQHLPPKAPTPSNIDHRPSENTKRQITVKSVNAGNRVWIDVLMTDTGASLAAKIHRIATFGTRKIIAITTAQGHTVPLTRRPIFGTKGIMPMDQVEQGDYWSVEWVPLEPSLMNKVLSKLIN